MEADRSSGDADIVANRNASGATAPDVASGEGGTTRSVLLAAELGAFVGKKRNKDGATPAEAPAATPEDGVASDGGTTEEDLLASELGVLMGKKRNEGSNGNSGSRAASQATKPKATKYEEEEMGMFFSMAVVGNEAVEAPKAPSQINGDAVGAVGRRFLSGVGRELMLGCLPFQKRECLPGDCASIHEASLSIVVM